MPDPTTPNKDLDLPAAGEYVNAWAPVVNANWTAIDTALGGMTPISVTSVGAGTITLTPTQYTPPNIEFTGVLSGNLNYQLPTGVGGLWTISNATSGAFTLQFSIAAGNALSLPAGRTFIVSDGVNVDLASSGFVPTADFLPSVTATYSIGSLTFEWRNGYFSGSLLAASEILSPGSGTTALTINVGGNADVGLYVNGDASGRQAAQGFQLNGALSGILGSAGTAGNLVSDSSAGDLVIRAQSAAIRLSVNGGISSAAELTVAGALENIDDGGTFQIVGWRDAPQNSQSGNYTCVMADRGKDINQVASGSTITIPANASVAYPLGTVLIFSNLSGGNISIAINSDTLALAGTSTTGTRTLVANGLAAAMKVGTTSWLIAGSGLS